MKKLFGIMIVVAISIIAGYNVYISQSNVKLSDLALSNVEALAYNGEIGDQSCAWVDSDYRYCRPWGQNIGCVCYQ